MGGREMWKESIYIVKRRDGASMLASTGNSTSEDVLAWAFYTLFTIKTQVVIIMLWW